MAISSESALGWKKVISRAGAGRLYRLPATGTTTSRAVNPQNDAD
jgi:hypothetical protein